MNLSFLKGFYVGALLILFLFILLVSLDKEGPGYKQGQVDALTGNVKYVLIEHPDKTKEWIRGTVAK